MKAFMICFRFIVIRMTRAPVGWIVGFALPLAMIPILGFALSWIPAGNSFLKGAPTTMSFFAIMLVIMFQLYAGGYSMELVRADLLSARKWRMHCLPCPVHVLVLAIIATTTLFSLAQGMTLVAFTRVALGVEWGGIGVIALVILATSLLAQLYHVVFILAFRNVGLAQGAAWVVNYGSVVLGGAIFPLPQNTPLIRFITNYGSPFSLAQRAVLDSLQGGSPAEIALCIGILFLAALACAGVVVLLGRRRLA